MKQEKTKNRYGLSIKKCLFYRNRLFYLASVILILSLFLILGFQNCTDKNSQTLPQLNNPDTIAELSLEETKHPDLLEISASVNSQVQDDFAAGSAVDLALSPSDHKNLQVLQESDVYTNWTISNEAWNYYNYNYPCDFITVCEIQKDGSELCTSDNNDSCNSPVYPIYKTITTVDSDTQFTFSDVGVYDISAHIQEIVPPKMVVNPDGSVTQGNFLYTDHGPRYEKSLVVGKCDQGDLQIINATDPIQNAPSTTSTTQTLNSITNSITGNDHLSYGYSYRQASRYASLFLLKLDGEFLEFEPSYYTSASPAIIDSGIEFKSQENEEKGNLVNQFSASTSDGSHSPSQGSDVAYPLPPDYYSDERKVKWNLMAEVIDSTYGRWYYRFDQQERLGGWYVPWPENGVRYFYDSNITSGATFSGKFIIEAFVQLPEGECVYSAKKAFQLSGNLIPSIEVEVIPRPQPLAPVLMTTSTTQGL